MAIEADSRRTGKLVFRVIRTIVHSYWITLFNFTAR